MVVEFSFAFYYVWVTVGNNIRNHGYVEKK